MVLPDANPHLKLEVGIGWEEKMKLPFVITIYSRIVTNSDKN